MENVGILRGVPGIDAARRRDLVAVAVRRLIFQPLTGEIAAVEAGGIARDQRPLGVEANVGDAGASVQRCDAALRETPCARADVDESRLSGVGFSLRETRAG